MCCSLWLAFGQPLQQPESRMHCRWGWRYDDTFQANSYTFTNLDLLSMTNINNKDPRLWVHLASSWVITWVVWRVRCCRTSLQTPSFRPFCVVSELLEVQQSTAALCWLALPVPASERMGSSFQGLLCRTRVSESQRVLLAAEASLVCSCCIDTARRQWPCALSTSTAAPQELSRTQ